MSQVCPICLKPLKRSKLIAFTSDGQHRYVGADCWRKIRLAGTNGYTTPDVGPAWYTDQLCAAAHNATTLMREI